MGKRRGNPDSGPTSAICRAEPLARIVPLVELGRVLMKPATSASPRLSAKHPNAEDGASRGNGTD